MHPVGETVSLDVAGCPFTSARLVSTPLGSDSRTKATPHHDLARERTRCVKQRLAYLPRMAIKGVDSSIFDQPRMREALRRRDIGTVYRLLVKHGVAQRVLAELVGQSQFEVSEILNGRQVQSYDVSFGLPRDSVCRDQ
jgi:hypothetical protein